ncbi:ribonuclease E/G [Hydrogenobaculum acidophilum]
MKLIVHKDKDLIFSMLFKNNELLDLKVDNLSNPEYTSAIFLGKIKSITQGVEGYFVDIGLKKDGYLPFKEADKTYKVGDYVIVQVKKEPSKFKGAKLTTKLNFRGKYIIYQEAEKSIKFSHLFDETLKNDYLEKIFELLTEKESIILRTQAKNADIKEIEKELIYFRQKIKRIKDISYKTIMELEEREPFYISMIKDYFSNIEKILVSDTKVYNDIVNFTLSNELNINIELVIDNQKLENLFEVEKHVNRLLSKYVWLESGGFLVIEETEAMVTIDVNSGKNTCDCIESSSFSTNLEAAKEIPRQLKLRNMGGIVMIDFIFMKDQNHRKEVLNILKDGFSKDNVQTTVYGYTALGLVEVARKKTGRSLTQIIKPHKQENISIIS